MPRLVVANRDEKPKRYSEGLLDGAKFIWNDRLLRAIVLTVMVTNFLDAPDGAVLAPVYAKQQFGSSFDLGLMFAALGGGSFLGAIVFGAIGYKFPKRPIFIIMFIIIGLRFWLLAAFPSLIVVLSGLFIAGLAAGPLNPMMITIMYERIPADMRGRILGTFTAGAWMAMPLGTLLGGIVLEQIGLQWTLIVLAIGYLVTTASLAMNPALNEIDQNRQAEYGELASTRRLA